MTTDKVTRDELRNLTIGKPQIYVLPAPSLCESVRVSCSYLKRFEGYDYKCSIDAENKTISVTRLK